jgi:hypothetical protein
MMKVAIVLAVKTMEVLICSTRLRLMHTLVVTWMDIYHFDFDALSSSDDDVW